VTTTVVVVDLSEKPKLRLLLLNSPFVREELGRKLRLREEELEHRRLQYYYWKTTMPWEARQQTIRKDERQRLDDAVPFRFWRRRLLDCLFLRSSSRIPRHPLLWFRSAAALLLL